jgi:hypothetical protein
LNAVPPAPLSEREVARRLPVWIALSEVFLDTRLDALDYRFMASAIRAAGLSPAEARAIFYEDVAPAFAGNLRLVAGQWAGWPDEVVRERVLARRGSWIARMGNRLFDQRLLEREWRKIAAALAEQAQISASST